MDALSAVDPGAAPAAGAPSCGTPRTLQLRRGEASPAALAKLKSVARGFDAVFTGTLLSELMKPVVGAGLGGSGPGASIVQGLIEQNLSDQIGKSGGFGIGRMLEKNLKPLLATQPVDATELQKVLTNRAAVDATAAQTPATNVATALGGGER